MPLRGIAFISADDEKLHFNPIRLFAEPVAIVAMAQASVTLGLLLPGLEGCRVAQPVVVCRTAGSAGSAGRSQCLLALHGGCRALAIDSGASGHPSHRRRCAFGGYETAGVQLPGLAATAGAVAWQQRALGDATRAKFERGLERIETEV